MYFLNLIFTASGNFLVGILCCGLLFTIAAATNSTWILLIILLIGAIESVFHRMNRRLPNCLRFGQQSFWFIGLITACSMLLAGIVYGLLQLRLH